MKKALLFWIPLVIASLIIVSCGSKSNEGDDEIRLTRKSIGGDSTGLVIAYYIQDSISSGFDFYRKIDSMLKAKEADFERILRGKYESYQRWEEMVAKRAEKNEISGFEMEALQREAMQKQQEIANYEQQRGGEIQRETVEYTKNLLNKISEAGREFSEENGIDMLFYYQKGGQITYISDAFDVTQQFINFLNRREKVLMEGFEEEVEKELEDKK
jgi:Skp family chaperone for outer membrane proteins